AQIPTGVFHPPTGHKRQFRQHQSRRNHRPRDHPHGIAGRHVSLFYLTMNKFGLIGFPLTHSFSKKYYDAKMEREQITGVDYQLYPIPDIPAFPLLLADEPQLMGVNVTIPYKVAVMGYLNHLSPEASAIGAVNCIRIERPDGGTPILTGYNTDVYGFVESLKPLLRAEHQRALVLGNGGA